MDALQISIKDNVAVALKDLKKSETIKVNAQEVVLKSDVNRGHKIALRDLKNGETVIKYGWPIGHLTADRKAGEKLDETCIKTNLSGKLSYEYHPIAIEPSEFAREYDKELTFKGYKRQNGLVATRNEVWIIPTVFCINTVINKLSELAQHLLCDYKNVDGCVAFPHPFGCSQMGQDQLTTQKVLKGLVNHPNAGAVLIVGLGCENNNIGAFKEILGDYDASRVKFLNCQDVEGNEVEEGLDLLKELFAYANRFERSDCPLSELKLGLKCGGSDGLSGITANPLIGTICDRVVACGGTAVMTEVPEMFGAEQLLMNRAQDQKIFEDEVKLINDFKQYYLSHGEVVSDNPSPGNKKGGISTLEEKSLGCVQKGGTAAVSGTLEYTEHASKKGLLMLQSPGNDGISTTALAVSGCTMILYSTGRGTPFGTAVPAVKVSSNTALFEKKPNWIDFNAGVLAQGADKRQLSDALLAKLIACASGEHTCDELHGFRDINIWKDGVSL